MKNKRCHICGGNLKMTDINGAIFPWKDFSVVKLLVSFNALNCAGCNEILLKGSDSEKLDEVLEESIRIMTSQFLHILKQNSKFTQKELARKIGITEVYFSEIISMKKTVSCQIFNYLKLLANHPNSLCDLDYYEGKGEQKDETQVSSLVKKYIYLDEDEIEQFENDRNFKTMLGNNTSRASH